MRDLPDRDLDRRGGPEADDASVFDSHQARPIDGDAGLAAEGRIPADRGTVDEDLALCALGHDAHISRDGLGDVGEDQGVELSWVQLARRDRGVVGRAKRRVPVRGRYHVELVRRFIFAAAHSVQSDLWPECVELIQIRVAGCGAVVVSSARAHESHWRVHRICDPVLDSPHVAVLAHREDGAACRGVHRIDPQIAGRREPGHLPEGQAVGLRRLAIPADIILGPLNLVVSDPLIDVDLGLQLVRGTLDRRSVDLHDPVFVIIAHIDQRILSVVGVV